MSFNYQLALDAAEARAYARRVGDDGQIPRDASSVIHRAARHRRRPPNPVEQAKRVAWGKRWGAIMSQHAKTYQRERG